MPQTSGTLQYENGSKDLPAEEVFEHISIATPYMDLIEEFTLLEMVDFHFTLKKPRTGLRKEDLLSRMYLEEASGKQLINFSSGMKQRLKLALAFYTQADIYFLDEPGTNLDKKAFEWYAGELAQLPQQSVIFIASNNPDEYPPHAVTVNIMDFKR